MNNTKTPIHNNWDVWYHRTDDEQWTMDSYQKIAVIRCWEDFWSVYQAVPTWLNGMFFLMRENIFPKWEDEQNIRGGYWSFKVSKTVGNETWTQLSAHCIGECATAHLHDMYYINGITISPKISNCIIKILNRDTIHCEPSRLTTDIPYLPPESVNFKAHLVNRNEFIFES